MGTIQKATHEHNVKSVCAVLQIMPLSMILNPCVHNSNMPMVISVFIDITAIKSLLIMHLDADFLQLS